MYKSKLLSVSSDNSSEYPINNLTMLCKDGLYRDPGKLESYFADYDKGWIIEYIGNPLEVKEILLERFKK